MGDEQARRVGLNEALFRSVNEQIDSLNHTFGERDTMTAVCECANGECMERLEISTADYERVRADPLRYIVVPGHEIPDFESVVEHGERYDVVRKRDGAPAEVSRETNPRS